MSTDLTRFSKFATQNTDYLDKIFEEQKDFDSKIEERIDKRYPTEMGKIFGECQAMLSEILEVHQELKPYWQWWRGLEVNPNDLRISDEKRARLIEELIDVFKFTLSSLIKLGVENSEQFYDEYMKKHKVIHQRLEDAKKGNDNYLVSETKSLL